MERWQRLRQLFEDALELSPSARPGFLEASCPDDPELRREVAALLASADQADEYLAGLAERVGAPAGPADGTVLERPRVEADGLVAVGVVQGDDQDH